MKTERFILLLLAAVNFTHIMDFMIMMPLSNVLIPYFDISTQQFSFLVAAYSVSAAVSGLTAAFFVDGFDRKKVLIVGYTGFIVGTSLCAVAPTYYLLLSSRIVAGLFGGLIGAQILSIASDLVPYERRAHAIGVIITAFSISSAFGVPFGLKMSDLFSWHAPFIIVAAMAIILLPLLIKYVPNMTGHINPKDLNNKPKLFDVFRAILTDRNQVIALLVTATLMGQFIIIPFLTSYMVFNVGFTNAQIPYIYLVGGISTMMLSSPIGRLADRKGKFKVFTVMALACVVPIALITNMPRTPFYFVLVVTGIWFVLSTGRAIAAQAMVTEVVPPKTRGSFMSINAAVQQLAVGIYSALAGFIVYNDSANKIYNYSITGVIAIGIIFICFTLAYYLNKAINKKLKAAANS
ncbi:MAG: MFS transporter [Flavipsychrobacter sp.]